MHSANRAMFSNGSVHTAGRVFSIVLILFIQTLALYKSYTYLLTYFRNTLHSRKHIPTVAYSHGWALGTCPPCPARPRWVMGFAQIRRVFWGLGGDGGRIRQQTSAEKHLTAANCLHISGFWGLRHQTLTGVPPLDRPQAPSAHPDFRAWLRHCIQNFIPEKKR